MPIGELLVVTPFHCGESLDVASGLSLVSPDPACNESDVHVSSTALRPSEPCCCKAQKLVQAEAGEESESRAESGLRLHVRTWHRLQDVSGCLAMAEVPRMGSRFTRSRALSNTGFPAPEPLA